MDKDTYFYVSIALIFLFGLTIFLFAKNSARHQNDQTNIDL